MEYKECDILVEKKFICVPFGIAIEHILLELLDNSL